MMNKNYAVAMNDNELAMVSGGKFTFKDVCRVLVRVGAAIVTFGESEVKYRAQHGTSL